MRLNVFVGNAAIVLSTFLWGLLWIPLRHLDRAGENQIWAVTAAFMSPLIVVIPLGIFRLRRLMNGGWLLLVAGGLNAVSVALYAEALLRGKVAHVILLFYLMPVWSTLLARLMLGEPITRQRVLTIVLGLTGMIVVFGAETGLPLPTTSAELMGLFSGLGWSFSMVYVRRSETSSSIDKTLVQLSLLGPAFFLAAALPGGRAWNAPAAGILLHPSTGTLAFGLLWMPAVLWLTLFGASRVEPGRAAILLMLEVIVGLVSAAALANEPLGIREALGAALIVSASGSEFLPLRSVTSSGR